MGLRGGNVGFDRDFISALAYTLARTQRYDP